MENNKIKLFTVPNLITSFNLLSGCVAIWAIFNNKIEWVPFLVILAAVFDFMDGFFARLLHSKSAIGKDLDSLADMVSFGIVPAFVMYYLLQTATATLNESWSFFIPFFGFLFAVFSALRLAKFNIDTRQTESFIGLATPANTLFISSLIWVSKSSYTGLSETVLSLPFLVAITLVFSFLLVSELPMFSFKFKHYKWGGNELRYLFLAASVAFIIFTAYLSVTLIILLYIIVSVGIWLSAKKQAKRTI